jgi:hypothetical protein
MPTTPSIVLGFEPDWSTEPELSYKFATVVQQTPYLVEQRRPLVDTPTRSMVCTFTEASAALQKLINTLLAAKSERLLVPVYTEPIFTDSIITGGAAITASTDLTYLWNLHNGDFVVVLDTVTGQIEALQIATVNGQQIVFTTNIVGSWAAGSTVIYPAIAAAVLSFRESPATDLLSSVEAEFEEVAIGSEAVEEWVGEEARMCVGMETTTILSNVNYLKTYDMGYHFITLSQIDIGKWSNTGFIAILQFDNVTLRPGWPVTSAHLRWELNFADGTSNSSVISIRYRAVLSSNANGMPYSYFDYLALTYTSASVVQNTVKSDWAGVTMCDSPSLLSVVQEIVSLPGWELGNSICIAVDGASSDNSAGVHFQHPAYNPGHYAPRLYVQ